MSDDGYSEGVGGCPDMSPSGYCILNKRPCFSADKFFLYLYVCHTLRSAVW